MTRVVKTRQLRQSEITAFNMDTGLEHNVLCTYKEQGEENKWFNLAKFQAVMCSVNPIKGFCPSKVHLESSSTYESKGIIRTTFVFWTMA